MTDPNRTRLARDPNATRARALLVCVAMAALAGCSSGQDQNNVPPLSPSPRTASPSRTPLGPTPDPSGGFPPAALVDRQVDWRKRHNRHIDSSDGAMAWANGAWRALTEWCEESKEDCPDESANYVTAVLGPEPRALFDECKWRREEEVIVDAYEFTWSILGDRRRATATELLDRYPAQGCDGE